MRAISRHSRPRIEPGASSGSGFESDSHVTETLLGTENVSGTEAVPDTETGTPSDTEQEGEQDPFLNPPSMVNAFASSSSTTPEQATSRRLSQIEFDNERQQEQQQQQSQNSPILESYFRQTPNTQSDTSRDDENLQEGDILDLFATESDATEIRRTRLHQILQGEYQAYAESNELEYGQDNLSNDEREAWLDSDVTTYIPTATVTTPTTTNFYSTAAIASGANATIATTPSSLAEILKSINDGPESDAEDAFFDDLHIGDDVELFKKVFGKFSGTFEIHKAEDRQARIHASRFPSANSSRRSSNNSNASTNTSSYSPTSFANTDSVYQEEPHLFGPAERHWAREEFQSIVENKCVDWTIDAPSQVLQADAVDDNTLMFRSLNEEEKKVYKEDTKAVKNVWLRNGMTFDIGNPTGAVSLFSKERDSKINVNRRSRNVSKARAEHLQGPKPNVERRKALGKGDSSSDYNRKLFSKGLPFVQDNKRNTSEESDSSEEQKDKQTNGNFMKIVAKEGYKYYAFIRNKMYVGKPVIPLNARLLGLGGRTWIVWKLAEEELVNNESQPGQRNTGDVRYGPSEYAFNFIGSLEQQISWLSERVRLLRLLSTTLNQYLINNNRESSEIFGLNFRDSLNNTATNTDSSTNSNASSDTNSNSNYASCRALPQGPATVSTLPLYSAQRDFVLNSYITMHIHVSNQFSRVQARASRMQNALRLYSTRPPPRRGENDTGTIQYTFGSNDYNSIYNNDHSYYYSGVSRSRNAVPRTPSPGVVHAGLSETANNHTGERTEEPRESDLENSAWADSDSDSDDEHNFSSRPRLESTSRATPAPQNETPTRRSLRRSSGTLGQPGNRYSTHDTFLNATGHRIARYQDDFIFGSAQRTNRQTSRRLNLAIEQSVENSTITVRRRSSTINKRSNRNRLHEPGMGYAASGSPFAGAILTGVRHRDGDLFFAESIFRCYKVGQNLVLASGDRAGSRRQEFGFNYRDWHRISNMFTGQMSVEEADLAWLIEKNLTAPVMSGIIERLKPTEGSWRGEMPVWKMT